MLLPYIRESLFFILPFCGSRRSHTLIMTASLQIRSSRAARRRRQQRLVQITLAITLLSEPLPQNITEKTHHSLRVLSMTVLKENRHPTNRKPSTFSSSMRKNDSSEQTTCGRHNVTSRKALMMLIRNNETVTKLPRNHRSVTNSDLKMAATKRSFTAKFSP